MKPDDHQLLWNLVVTISLSIFIPLNKISNFFGKTENICDQICNMFQLNIQKLILFMKSSYLCFILPIFHDQIYVSSYALTKSMQLFNGPQHFFIIVLFRHLIDWYQNIEDLYHYGSELLFPLFEMSFNALEKYLIVDCILFLAKVVIVWFRSFNHAIFQKVRLVRMDKT